jgi:glycosyltransferase involved in cell wall biosynthesis
MDILFVHNGLTRFARIDRDLLAERWRVTEWHQRGRMVNVPALVRAIRQSDVVFGWFASWHTFLPGLLAARLRRPFVLVVGGYDVADLPDIGYGHQRRRAVSRRLVSRSTAAAAAVVSPFSQFSTAEALQNMGVRKDRVRMIYLGVPDFASDVVSARAPMALTVGGVDKSNMRRKGHLAFVRAASHLPDVPFVLAGEWLDGAIDRLREASTPNVTFTGRLTRGQLEDQYRRASVYVQASQHEGFGFAVAEAMLGGAIPVVSRVGALPEVAGDTGVQVTSTDPADLAAAISRALQLGASSRQAARNRILESFPISRRRDQLYDLIESAADTTRAGVGRRR